MLLKRYFSIVLTELIRKQCFSYRERPMPVPFCWLWVKQHCWLTVPGWIQEMIKTNIVYLIDLAKHDRPCTKTGFLDAPFLE